MTNYSFGRFELNVATRQLSRNGEPVPLTAKVFDTLVVLVSNYGRVVTKDELMKAVWQDAVVGDDSLTQNIRALRRTLGDDAGEPEYITTVARRGYRFIKPVAELSEPSAPAPTATVAPPPPAAAPPPPRHTRGPWLMAIIGALVGAAGALLMFTAAGKSSAETPARVLHLNLSPPPGTTLESGAALSPNAGMIALVASDARSGRSNLWITDLSSGQSQPLPGTEGAARPVWSRDGTTIAFFANGALRSTELGSGIIRTLSPVRTSSGASWTADKRVLFADLRSPISAIPITGGPATQVTSLDASKQEIGHRWPHVLPDGRRFLYYVDSSDDSHAGTYVGDLDSPLKQRIIDVAAVYSEGYLIYVRNRVLMAQRFDVDDFSFDGAPVTLAADASPLDITTSAALSAEGELLAYGGGGGVERMTWFSRSGARLGQIESPAGLYNPFLLRDGRQLLAATGAVSGPRGIWLIDLERGAAARMTVGMRPLASPDGTQVAFTDDRATGVADVYVRPIAGPDRNQLVFRSTENKMVDDWSPDGRSLIVASTSPTTKTDLWLLAVAEENPTPQPLVRTPANELHARVSPDGRWLAYASDETGRLEVYVQSLTQPGVRRAVSVDGGTEPRWRRDGRELFYLSADLAVMAVDVSTGPGIRLGAARRLFRVPMARGRSIYVNHYDVSADGQRFVIQSADQNPTPPLMVLLNWKGLTPEGD